MKDLIALAVFTALLAAWAIWAHRKPRNYQPPAPFTNTRPPS